MKEYSNKEILTKVTQLIGKKWVSIPLIAISAGLSGILLQDVSLARILHALLFGLTTGIVSLLLCTVLFCTLYTVLYLPKAIKWKGSIQRMEYFLVMLGTIVIYLLNNFVYAPERYGLDYTPNNLMKIVGFVIAFFLIYIQICACVKRLNDLKWSKWLAVIDIIPIISFGIRIPCLFLKSKSIEDDNVVHNITKEESLNEVENDNVNEEAISVHAEANKPKIQIKEPLRTIFIVTLSVLITAIVSFAVCNKLMNTVNIGTDNIPAKIYSPKVDVKNAYWIPIDEDVSFDMKSIRQEKEYASIVGKMLFNGRGNHGKLAKYLCFVNVYKKDSSEYRVPLMIELDDNMEVIGTTKLPYGQETLEYQEGSQVAILKDIAFLSKDKMKNAKAIFDMGILDYFTPYVETGSKKSKAESEAQLRALLGK